MLKTLGLVPILALIVVLLGWGSSLHILAYTDSQQESNLAEILVQFQPGTSASTIAEVHCQNGGRVVEVIPQIGVQVVEVPASQLQEKLAAYLSCPFVEYAEPDSQGQIMAIPSDSGFGGQWNMSQVQAPQAWDISHGSPAIDIAILDTGIDQDHPDLSSKIVANVNFSSSPSFDDYYRHGTHVAGIAAAITDNGMGVAGLGYDSSLMNVKVFADDGSASASALAQGILWAADHGAEVININMIYGYPSTTLENAVNYAWEKGAVLVAAAGNYGNSRATYPGAFSNCIAVAATNADDNLASWSTYGDWVSVAAPGVSIYSTLPDGYGYGGGTCMASPLVSGLAALLFTVVTDTNGDGRLNDEVRYALESTCDDIGAKVAHGRINAYRAMTASVSSLGSISGTVTDVGTSQPVEGATVGCGSRQTKIDSSGSYIIAGVPEGSCTVTVSAPGYHSASERVSVTAGATFTADFDLTPLPRADFRAALLSGSEPLTVDFSDTSTSYDGVTSWRWDFGDGDTSSEQNPTHIYTQEGVYIVSLSITEADGDSDTETKVDYITVSDSRPGADFWAAPLSGDEPLVVSFSDSSTSYDGITSWLWDFGDGSTSSEQNPTHSYTAEGTYTVSLTVSDGAASDTKTKIGYISVTKAPVEQSVPPTSEASIEAPDGRISLQFPPDALADETEVLIKQESAASVSSTFEPAGDDPNLLDLSRYDEATGQGTVNPATLDAPTETLTAATDQFSQGIVGARPSASSVLSIVGILLGGLVPLVGSGAGYLVWRSKRVPRCQKQTTEEDIAR